MKYIFIKISCLLFIALFFVQSCKSKKNSDCDAYGTINWEVNADTISVTRDDITYLDAIPSNGAKSIHINTNEKGTYVVLLKSDGSVVDVKKLTIR